MDRIPELVETTLNRLSTQAALHVRGDPQQPPFIPILQLRDDVLRSELQGSRRQKIWNGVRKHVEGNANVRVAFREGRGGDVSRVWEWIGGIGSVDVSAAGKRENHVREENHVTPSHVPSDSASKNNWSSSGVFPESMGVRKWDEGRHIY